MRNLQYEMRTCQKSKKDRICTVRIFMDQTLFGMISNRTIPEIVLSETVLSTVCQIFFGLYDTQ